MLSTTTYIEDNLNEFGVEHHWKMARIPVSFETKRGTKVEIVKKPLWGLTCYMNNSVQSCLKDEQIYHESLVVPVLSCVETPKRVCIIGGGEGATLREVLKFPGVEEVDMYEWDKEVVNLFRTDYKEWSQGAFEDPRVILIYENIFEIMNEKPNKPYDAIIVDLFEPDEQNYEQWKELLTNLNEKWLSENGSMVMYSGMRNILSKPAKEPYQKLIDILTLHTNLRTEQILHSNRFVMTCVPIRDIIPYKVFIPSFTGESTFILLKNKDIKLDTNKFNKSHLTEDIWDSYKTFNW